MNIERSCATCLTRCITPLRTCLNNNYSLWRINYNAVEVEVIEEETDYGQEWLLQEYAKTAPKSERQKQLDYYKDYYHSKRKRNIDDEARRLDCERKMQKYWENPEKYREDHKQYYRKNKEKVIASNAAYKKRIKEEDPARWAEWKARERANANERNKHLTPEQKKAKNESSHKWWIRMIATETPEHKEERLKKDRLRKQKKRDAMTPEQQQAAKDKRNAKRREQRAQEREKKEKLNAIKERLKNEIENQETL